MNNTPAHKYMRRLLQHPRMLGEAILEGVPSFEYPKCHGKRRSVASPLEPCEVYANTAKERNKMHISCGPTRGALTEKNFLKHGEEIRALFYLTAHKCSCYEFARVIGKKYGIGINQMYWLLTYLFQ